MSWLFQPPENTLPITVRQISNYILSQNCLKTWRKDWKMYIVQNKQTKSPTGNYLVRTHIDWWGAFPVRGQIWGYDICSKRSKMCQLINKINEKCFLYTLFSFLTCSSHYNFHTTKMSMCNKKTIMEACMSYKLGWKCFFCPFMMHESKCSTQAVMNTVWYKSEAY